jgi:hypothetical protein
MAVVLAALASVAYAAEFVPVSRGEAIYREGRFASGATLHAGRNGAVLEGSEAACVNCHRRSGLGSYEGSVLVPPVIGPYLFRSGAANTQDLNLPHIAGYVPNDYAYTESMLALALRTGVAPDGRTLSPLMPRYTLDDPSIQELSDYLKGLSSGPFPGVDAHTLELATIVTAETDPIASSAMLMVLNRFFDGRNAAVASRVQTGRSTAAAAEYRTVRNWRLHVWQLSGQPDSWEAQLQRLQATEPVFAVISGLGGKTWAPVHRFCEDNRVPCLFPNVDLPHVVEGDYYPVYFSRGVLLEGDLILARVLSPPNVSAPAAARIFQIYRKGDIGDAAAAALAQGARKSHVTVTNRALAPRPAAAGNRTAAAEAKGRAQLESALSGVRPQDTLVLWLRPEDLAALGKRVSAEVYISGSMADLEAAPLPEEWRDKTRMTYPYDPPALRRMRENFSHAWLRKQGIPVTADRVQSNTYLSCMILADALDEMLDAFVPDLLVERVENMLGARLNTGYFPRLSLAPGQRFASKGGYIVKFEARNYAAVVPDGSWLVP